VLRKCEGNETEKLKNTIFEAFQTRGFMKEIDDTNEELAQTIIGCAALLMRYWDRTRLDKEMLRGGKHNRR
jgi:hypothetical protein